MGKTIPSKSTLERSIVSALLGFWEGVFLKVEETMSLEVFSELELWQDTLSYVSKRR